MEKQNNFNEYAFSLIIEEFEGSISEVQKMELQAWRQASIENEKIYREFYEIKSEIDSLSEFNGIDIDASWKKVDKGLAAPYSEEPPAVVDFNSSKRGTYRWIYGIAASIILVIGLFIFRPSQPDLLETAKGGQKRIVLPDGSFVALNGETMIRYDSSTFAAKRELTLIKGEAFFRVLHNPQKPFLIRTNETTIEDLGTSFLVSKGDGTIKVSVSSGKVALKALATGESRIISAGNSGTYLISRKIITDTPVIHGAQLHSFDSQLSFVNADLADIVVKLKSVYGKTIVIKDSVLRHRKLTAPLAYQTVDSALSVISASLQVKVVRTGSTFVISK